MRNDFDPCTKRSLVVLILSLGTISCQAPLPSANQNDSMIIDGQKVKEGDPVSRVTVALVSKLTDGTNRDVPYCSGVLVAPRTVLTAAHCTDQNEIRVAFGLGWHRSPVIRSGTATRHPGHRAPHTDWNHFDLAVVRLNEAAPAFMQAVKIAPVTSVRSGAKVILAGYGQTYVGQSRDDLDRPDLYQVESRIDSIDSMDDLEGQGLLYLLNSANRAGACHGDSGGPVLVNGTQYLLGLIVGGADCSQGAGNATNVVYWWPWLQQQGIF